MIQDVTIGDRQLRVEASGELRAAPGGWLVPAGPVSLEHPIPTGSFYRHGWHSWKPARWVDLQQPPAHHAQRGRASLVGDRHAGSWVGAIQGDPDGVLLLGGLGLETQVGASPTELIGRSGGPPAEWLLAFGTEREVFARYAELLGERLGARRPAPGRVWCSWYSYWRGIDEQTMTGVLDGLDGLPFDVVQIDDGWQRAVGDWQPNEKFPHGMKAMAQRIGERGYRPGLWIAPFVAQEGSRLFRDHPDWCLADRAGRPMVAGVNWGGRYYGLDLTQPRVEDFVRDTIARARDWGFTYLKLDFVFGGALIAAADGARPGEAAYRSAMQAIREVVGDDGYLLACGAPVVPSIGVADAIRIGPDVAPHWEIDARPSDATYAEPAARHAVSTSLGRLWLWPVIAVDPDVVFFRRRDCRLSAEQKSYVRDMATICGYVGTSDPPGWLGPGERRALTDYLRQDPEIRRLDRYRFSIDGRQADFSPVVLDDPGAVRLGLAMPADPHLPWGSR